MDIVLDITVAIKFVNAENLFNLIKSHRCLQNKFIISLKFSEKLHLIIAPHRFQLLSFPYESSWLHSIYLEICSEISTH